MALDLLLPVTILVAIVIYLIYSRNQFEKKMLNLYEEKFEAWKKHNPSTEASKESKEFVGLIFKENGKISIELHNDSAKRPLEQGKFEIKES